MIAQRFKEIDKRSIPVIVDFDLAEWFGEEYARCTTKNFYVDLMRRKEFDDARR
jgi:hypothetical protein